MNKSQIEKSLKIVEQNRKLDDPIELFYFQNTSISDPYFDIDLVNEIDPETYYGEVYVNWVNSL